MGKQTVSCSLCLLLLLFLSRSHSVSLRGVSLRAVTIEHLPKFTQTDESRLLAQPPKGEVTFSRDTMKPQWHRKHPLLRTSNPSVAFTLVTSLPTASLRLSVCPLCCSRAHRFAIESAVKTSHLQSNPSEHHYRSRERLLIDLTCNTCGLGQWVNINRHVFCSMTHLQRRHLRNMITDSQISFIVLFAL